MIFFLTTSKSKWNQLGYWETLHKREDRLWIYLYGIYTMQQVVNISTKGFFTDQNLNFLWTCWAQSIYYASESDIRVKGYEHMNFLRASIVQFRASRYIIDLNQTSVSKVMALWFFPCTFMFNFYHLDILCTWIGHPSQNFWAFEFLESFHCSISSISTYYWPESDIQAKIYGRFNLPCASMFNF